LQTISDTIFFFVMNITDIDDKIIKRARQNYLFEKYMAEERSLGAVLNDAKLVLENLLETTQNAIDYDKKQMYEKLLEK
jgi:cysteinyl-tRNA synthetase